jgi:hypothetical protein
MNPLENEDVNLDHLLNHYFCETGKEKMNMKRIKKFYNDENGFNELMNRIIEKDRIRFEKLGNMDLLPNPWRVFFVILDIVQNDGVEVEPYDVLTKMFPSKTLIYMGWTFSWVHGESTLFSVYNREDELVYRF